MTKHNQQGRDLSAAPSTAPLSLQAAILLQRTLSQAQVHREIQSLASQVNVNQRLNASLRAALEEVLLLIEEDDMSEDDDDNCQ